MDAFSLTFNMLTNLSLSKHNIEMKSFADNSEDKENIPSLKNLEINKLYDFPNSTIAKSEITNIHSEIRDKLNFYLNTGSRKIPKTFDVECKMNGKWETLVIAEKDSKITISLLGKEDKRIVLKDVNNMLDVHQMLNPQLYK